MFGISRRGLAVREPAGSGWSAGEPESLGNTELPHHHRDLARVAGQTLGADPLDDPAAVRTGHYTLHKLSGLVPLQPPLRRGLGSRLSGVPRRS